MHAPKSLARLVLVAAVVVFGVQACGDDDTPPSTADAGRTTEGGIDGGPGACASLVNLNTAGMPTADGVRYVGSTGSGGRSQSGSCAGAGPEIVFSYTADADGTITVSTVDAETIYDTVVYARTSCEDRASELACNDDASGTLQSEVSVAVTAGATVFFFVDGPGSGDSGGFAITARFVGGTTDDGGVDGGEQDGGVDGGGGDGGVCAPDLGDCDGDPSNGCEAALGTDVMNCGVCGNMCRTRPQSAPTCASGACGYACAAGFEDCDGRANNGCEAEVATDARNCGMCGNRCRGMVCCAGMCAAMCM